MKVITAAEMSAIDRATSEQYGVHSLALMENAGSAVANFAREYWPAANRITMVCGRGNNGGDGFVAARRLHAAGKVVEVLLLGSARGLESRCRQHAGAPSFPTDHDPQRRRSCERI